MTDAIIALFAGFLLTFVPGVIWIAVKRRRWNRANGFYTVKCPSCGRITVAAFMREGVCSKCWMSEQDRQHRVVIEAVTRRLKTGARRRTGAIK